MPGLPGVMRLGGETAAWFGRREALAPEVMVISGVLAAWIAGTSACYVLYK